MLTGNAGRDVFILSKANDVISDFKLSKDAIGLVYELDLTFTQVGDDLLIEGTDRVSTLLLDVSRSDFLENYPNNLQIVPAVSVDVL